MSTFTTSIQVLPISNLYSEYKNEVTGRIYYKKVLYVLFSARGGYEVSMRAVEKDAFLTTDIQLTGLHPKDFIRYVRRPWYRIVIDECLDYIGFPLRNFSNKNKSVPR